MRKKKSSQKIARWKREQLSRQRQKRRLVFQKLAIVFLCLCLVTALVTSWWLLKHRTWKGEEKFNFAIVSQEKTKLRPVWWVSLDPKTKTGLIFYFSDNLVIEAVGGYGTYKAQSLPALGELEGKNATLLQDSFQELFGLKTDGTLIASSKIDFDPASNALRWLKLITSQAIIKPYLGRMNWLDRLRLIWLLQNINQPNLDFIDLQDSRLVYPQILPDGNQVYGVDLLRLDSFIQHTLSNEAIAQEMITVAVFNQTSHSQLAARAARPLVNSSVNVVSVDTGDQQLDHTIIRLARPDLKQSKTINQIKKFFPQAKIIVSETQTERFDIVVEVGEDYWYWLSGQP